MESNKGYFKPSGILGRSLPEQEREILYTVKCNNCNATWKEKFMEEPPKAIAGYRRIYDYCDRCKGDI
jgi:hypothetical protein